MYLLKFSLILSHFILYIDLIKPKFFITNALFFVIKYFSKNAIDFFEVLLSNKNFIENIYFWNNLIFLNMNRFETDWTIEFLILEIKYDYDWDYMVLAKLASEPLTTCNFLCHSHLDHTFHVIFGVLLCDALLYLSALYCTK